ncbi:hypothetical protein H072_7688 [Dactylellina haptotyla CBS 200.50]|uniref:F-box domain-containing protein n=1 Tax=Dactylellina haptotyla (strain CBS 200.50) TaxID=1284197 RepID=S8BGX7_DACHA|nr:hypothetical protein H072_7688 [Dactylellina haptotyla CBS 200.50]
MENTIFRAPRESRFAPLRLSAASNGLQFSHHFQNSYGSNSYQPPRLLGVQYYADAPAVSRLDGRPAKKQQTAVLTPVDPNKGTARPNLPVLRRTVSSLVPPEVPLKSLARSKGKNDGNLRPKANTKAMTAAKSLHRLSSSAASIHSTTSSFRSRKRKYYQVACLTSMPCEILDQIFCHLGQKELHAILLSNKYLADSAAPALYATPKFASTYRFAQFVSLITHNALLANLVRELDLSNISAEVPEDLPLAGWRDWKYRTDPLHTIRRDDFNRRRGGKAPPPSTQPKGAHPLPSPFLAQYHTCRDVPFGAVLHILVACQRLRKVNLSNILIAADYAVLPTKHSVYRPTTFTKLLFVSDVPKAYTWRSDETRAINAGVEVVEAILNLRYLETFYTKHGIWLTSNTATKLVQGNLKVEWDFRECGGYKGEKWAVKGSSDEIYALLSE